MNLTCGGGSSTSLSRALKPCRGHHVRLVDDVDLVAAADRGEERPLAQVAGVVDAAVAGGVDLDHVDAARTAAGQVAAGLALAARLGARTRLAVQRAGQDAGRGGLATAARTGEQVGVVDPVVGQRPLQRLGDVLLADDVGEGVRVGSAGTAPTGLPDAASPPDRAPGHGWLRGLRGRRPRAGLPVLDRRRSRTGRGRPSRTVRVRRRGRTLQAARPRARRPRVNHTCWRPQFSTA